MNKIKTCIFNILGSETNAPKHFQKSFFHDMIAGAVGLAANIFTLGAWGGIKGGYYLIQLALDLKKTYDNTMKDAAFNVGKLIGQGVLIAKSAVLGRRILRHRKNKK
jgi:hypothetical protein